MSRLTRQEYQKKYEKQLTALNLVGYYKIVSTKDEWYYRSFKISEPLDYYHQGYITYGVFYNPNTQDIVSVCETDWDREGLDDFDKPAVSSIYGGDYPIDVMNAYEKQCKVALYKENERRREVRLKEGICTIGDTVEIVKGRKLPIGEIKTIQEKSNYFDKFGRYRCTYAIFTDGTRINIENCKLVKQADMKTIMEYANKETSIKYEEDEDD